MRKFTLRSLEARFKDIVARKKFSDGDAITSRRDVVEFASQDACIVCSPTNCSQTILMTGAIGLSQPPSRASTVAGKSRLSGERDAIVYYKNNTGLAIQFAACGAILYRKLKAEGAKRTIPREWFAGLQYGL